jgi:hypothetical protein
VFYDLRIFDFGVLTGVVSGYFSSELQLSEKFLSYYAGMMET